MAYVAQFHEVYLAFLEEARHMESQVNSFIPELIHHASHPELRDFLENQVDQTGAQIARLDAIFGHYRYPAPTGESESMHAIVVEHARMLGNVLGGEMQDVVIIAALKRIKAFEIATYSILTDWTKYEEYQEAGRQLNRSLAEEHEALADLDRLSQGGWFTTGITKGAAKAGAAKR